MGLGRMMRMTVCRMGAGHVVGGAVVESDSIQG